MQLKQYSSLLFQKPVFNSTFWANFIASSWNVVVRSDYFTRKNLFAGIAPPEIQREAITPFGSITLARKHVWSKTYLR